MVGFIAGDSLLTTNQNKTIILYIDSMNLNQGIVSFFTGEYSFKNSQSSLEISF